MKSLRGYVVNPQKSFLRFQVGFAGYSPKLLCGPGRAELECCHNEVVLFDIGSRISFLSVIRALHGRNRNLYFVAVVIMQNHPPTCAVVVDLYKVLTCCRRDVNQSIEAKEFRRFMAGNLKVQQIFAFCRYFMAYSFLNSFSKSRPMNGSERTFQYLYQDLQIPICSISNSVWNIEFRI